MKSHNKRAQSTLEYIIILTAIIVAILVVMRTFAAQTKNSGMGRLVDAAGNMIRNATGRLP